VQASRPDVRRVLNEGGAAVGGGAAQRMRSVLAAGQLALSVALLAGAGLMIKTVVRTFTFDAGYDVTRVLVGDVALAGPRYDDPAQILAFGESVIARLGRLPGVRAAIGRTVFLRGFGAEPRRIVAEGVASVSADASPSFYDAVTPGYFAALGLTVREGRDFEPAERTGVIVNRELARRVWGTRPALGQRFQFGDEATRAQWFTVVGLVDVPGGSPIAVNPNRPVAYVPIAAAPGRELAVTVGTDGNPAALVSEVRAAVAAADPDQPIEDLKTMEAAFAQWVTPARAVGALMASLAAVALLMAAMGTFGVVAFSVSRRSREIGVRLALGATPRQVQALMAGAGVRLAAAGLAFGLPAAWLSTRTLEGILAGTSPTDPMAFTAAVLLLVLATLIAAWLPARRAARIDPLTVLRQE
jgi:predicted permease